MATGLCLSGRVFPSVNVLLVAFIVVGVVLPPGQSIFGGKIIEDDDEMHARLERLANDEQHRTEHLAACHSREFHDCGPCFCCW